MPDPNTTGGKILKWLRDHPEDAIEVAYAAVGGLYLDDCYEKALHPDSCNPRGSGSDYVDEVGEAIRRCPGLQGIIIEAQKEVEDA